MISTLPTSYPGHSILTEDVGEIVDVKNCKCGKNKSIFIYTVELKKLKQEVVAMFKNFCNIKFLVGDSKFEKFYLLHTMMKFAILGDFSKELSNKIYNDLIDLKSLSFWCRKNNLDKIKKSFFK